MQLFRIALILLAGAAVAGQLVQERYRLSVMEKLPVDQAMQRYQAARRKGERGMVILTAVSGLIGLAALLDLVIANVSQR